MKHTSTHNDLPVWGNWLETHVQLRPCPNRTTPTIVLIGNVELQYIDIKGNGETLPTGKFVDGGYIELDSPTINRQCPFGWTQDGGIPVAGPPIGVPGYIGPGGIAVPGEYLYRLVYRKPTVTTSYPVLNPITVLAYTATPPIATVTPDPSGYVPYLSLQGNFHNILASWQPPPGQWQIRLEMANTGPLPLTTISWTDWYNISVNSYLTNPTTGDVEFMGNPTCGNFTIDTILKAPSGLSRATFISIL